MQKVDLLFRSTFRHLGGDALWLSLGHLVSRSALTVSAILVARAYGTSEFASYAYFQMTVVLFGTYASFGLGIAASKFFAEVSREDHEMLPVAPLRTLLAVGVMIPLFSFAVVLLLPSHYLTGGLAISRLQLAFGVAVVAFSVIPAGAVLGLGRFKESALVSVASAFIMISGTHAAGLIEDFKVALASLIFSLGLLALGNLLIVVRAVGLGRLMQKGEGIGRDLRRIFAFAVPMLLASLVSATGGWILGRSLLSTTGDYAFAIYSIGLQWLSLALIFPGMIARASWPKLIQHVRDGAGRVVWRLVEDGVKLSVGAAIVMCCVGTIASPLILSLYGDSYRVEGWYLGAFMVAAVFASAASTFGYAIVAIDQHWRWFVLNLIWISVLLLVAWQFIGLGAWVGPISFGAAGIVLSVSSGVAWRRGWLKRTWVAMPLRGEEATV